MTRTKKRGVTVTRLGEASLQWDHKVSAIELLVRSIIVADGEALLMLQKLSIKPETLRHILIRRWCIRYSVNFDDVRSALDRIVTQWESDHDKRAGGRWDPLRPLFDVAINGASRKGSKSTAASVSIRVGPLRRTKDEFLQEARQRWDEQERALIGAGANKAPFTTLRDFAWLAAWQIGARRGLQTALAKESGVTPAAVSQGIRRAAALAGVVPRSLKGERRHGSVE